MKLKCAYIHRENVLRHFYFIYFPNGGHIDYLSLTYATNKRKILKLRYIYYKYYKQH